MSVEEMNEQRHAIMTALDKEFAEDKVPAKLVFYEETGIEMLTVLMEDLAGEGMDSIAEFGFMPRIDDEDFQIFSCVITVLDEISDEYMGPLTAALASINLILPVGCFAIEPATDALIYKHHYEMLLDLDTETLKDSVDLCMGAAVETVQNFVQSLLDINNGIGVEEEEDAEDEEDI